MLRQVVVGWEVLLIEVKAVALSLEAKLLVQDHEGHVLTTALLGSSTLLGRGGGKEVWHHWGPRGGGAVGMGRRTAVLDLGQVLGLDRLAPHWLAP